jgi:toluene monooxygenase electron transfer component
LITAQDITHDIREFHFALEKPAMYRPGQYALLSLPNVDGARAYSMSDTPGDGSEWSFQIRRTPNGAATGFLFDRVAIGDVIGIDGPYGMAYLREDADRDILCLAGGSGLSPMMSIARAVARAPELADRNLHFLFGGRTTRDIAGESMLRELPGYGERIKYYAAISMPENDSPASAWTGHVGHVPDVARNLFGDQLPAMEIYFAGPPAMANAVIALAVEFKVPQAQLHFDQYF